MPKTILITGSNGLLGQKLVYNLLGRNRSGSSFHIIATSKGENRLRLQQGYTYVPLDITDAEEVKKVFAQYRPDVVINTAAMTNVDACETQREQARLLNVDAVAYQLRALENLRGDAYNPHFIHLSTDFIFDGEAGPYSEDDTPNPLSWYAQTKLDAEQAVMQSAVRWAILRTIIVYGIADFMSRSNVVLWAREALGNGKQINVVNDQFRTPTLAEDLAEGCILCAEKEAQGVYHVSGKDFMSILELVYAVADYWQLDKSLVTPVQSATINQPARRPPRTGFVIDKARNAFGYNPRSFREGLALLDLQLQTV
ncbi:MAG: SDR family oxidoreductase [Bacteroidia bacterium]|jgi:dTDP-4-dehydrorhamnose reductase|nr:SDR family oxidoreductase [Bacteroidia bacterium]